jgi:hypothetical protein
MDLTPPPTLHSTWDVNNDGNPALALLGQGLKKSPIGQKLDFANHPYLCKGLFLNKIYCVIFIQNILDDLVFSGAIKPPLIRIL